MSERLYLGVTAAVVMMAFPVCAQHDSSQAAIGMTATVLPNLRLEPTVFALENAAVMARVVPEGPDAFRVDAQLKGRGKAILQIPVRLRTNVKSFILRASSTSILLGSVQMTGARSESITLLSGHKPLQSSSIFALGLPGTGRHSAAGTLSGIIEISLSELSQEKSRLASIRLSIAQR